MTWWTRSGRAAVGRARRSSKRGSVRIPGHEGSNPSLSVQRGPCRRFNDAACLTRMVGAGGVGSARANAGQQGSMGSFPWTFAQATVSCVGIRAVRPRVPRPGTIAQARVNVGQREPCCDGRRSLQASGQCRNREPRCWRIAGRGPSVRRDPHWCSRRYVPCRTPAASLLRAGRGRRAFRGRMWVGGAVSRGRTGRLPERQCGSPLGDPRRAAQCVLQADADAWVAWQRLRATTEERASVPRMSATASNGRIVRHAPEQTWELVWRGSRAR